MTVNTKIRLNKEIETLILQYNRDGFTRKEISEKTGYLYLSGISKVLKNHNIPTNNRLIENKQLVEDVTRLYKSGLSLNKISKEVGTSYSAVSNLLKKLNIRIPVKMKYYIQDDMFFENIDTEEKAYWFGFIIADGNIDKRQSALTIVSNERDADHLILFLNSINSTNSIKKYKTIKNEKTSNMVRACIYSPIMCKSLISKGVRPNKTENLLGDVVSWVPDHLFNHFIRGLFDGDGCWKSRKYKCPIFNIVNKSYSFVNALKFKLDTILDIDCKIYNAGSVKSLELVKIMSNVKMFNYIYQNATLQLKRKYNKMFNFIQTRKDCKFCNF